MNHKIRLSTMLMRNDVASGGVKVTDAEKASIADVAKALKVA